MANLVDWEKTPTRHGKLALTASKRKLFYAPLYWASGYKEI